MIRISLNSIAQTICPFQRNFLSVSQSTEVILNEYINRRTYLLTEVVVMVSTDIFAMETTISTSFSLRVNFKIVDETIKKLQGESVSSKIIKLEVGYRQRLRSLSAFGDRTN